VPGEHPCNNPCRSDATCESGLRSCGVLAASSCCGLVLGSAGMPNCDWPDSGAATAEEVLLSHNAGVCTVDGSRKMWCACGNSRRGNACAASQDAALVPPCPCCCAADAWPSTLSLREGWRVLVALCKRACEAACASGCKAAQTTICQAAPAERYCNPQKVFCSRLQVKSAFVCPFKHLIRCKRYAHIVSLHHRLAHEDALFLCLRQVMHILQAVVTCDVQS
jgi:hypothetical protein